MYGGLLLAHTIEAAAASGDYDVMELDVDSDSLTGATRLYEGLGFTIKHTSDLMRKSPSAEPSTSGPEGSGRILRE